MAKQKIKLVSAGKLDKTGWKKLWKSFVISVVGGAIVYIGQLTEVVDFGGYEVVAVAFVPFVINFLRKWLADYEVIL